MSLDKKKRKRIKHESKPCTQKVQTREECAREKYPRLRLIKLRGTINGSMCQRSL